MLRRPILLGICRNAFQNMSEKIFVVSRRVLTKYLPLGTKQTDKGLPPEQSVADTIFMVP